MAAILSMPWLKQMPGRTLRGKTDTGNIDNRGLTSGALSKIKAPRPEFSRSCGLNRCGQK
jgi:hypothetical protein